MKTFKQYLEERHSEVYMIDSFDKWMSELNVSEIMIYTEGWMNEYMSFIRQIVHEVTK